jgi:hypothetical protein
VSRVSTTGIFGPKKERNEILRQGLEIGVELTVECFVNGCRPKRVDVAGETWTKNKGTGSMPKVEVERLWSYSSRPDTRPCELVSSFLIGVAGVVLISVP